MEQNILTAVYTILGIGAIIGGIKGVDWLIGLKYKSKDDCEKCRNNIFERLNYDSTTLTRIETKVDLIMKNFNLKSIEDIHERKL